MIGTSCAEGERWWWGSMEHASSAMGVVPLHPDFPSKLRAHNSPIITRFLTFLSFLDCENLVFLRLFIVQWLSYVWLFSTSWTAAHQVLLSFTISSSLPKLMSIELVMPSNHLILCCPLLLRPWVFPSIRVFSNESVLRIRWPKYCRFSISPSNEYSGLISFWIDWFDLLLSNRHSRVFSSTSLKASVLWP